jgi:hypothetical protein
MDPETLTGIEAAIWATAFVLYRRNQAVTDGWIDANEVVIDYRAERERRKEATSD